MDSHSNLSASKQQRIHIWRAEVASHHTASSISDASTVRTSSTRTSGRDDASLATSGVVAGGSLPRRVWRKMLSKFKVAKDGGEKTDMYRDIKEEGFAEREREDPLEAKRDRLERAMDLLERRGPA